MNNEELFNKEKRTLCRFIGKKNGQRKSTITVPAKFIKMFKWNHGTELTFEPVEYHNDYLLKGAMLYDAPLKCLSKKEIELDFADLKREQKLNARSKQMANKINKKEKIGALVLNKNNNLKKCFRISDALYEKAQVADKELRKIKSVHLLITYDKDNTGKAMKQGIAQIGGFAVVKTKRVRKEKAPEDEYTEELEYTL